jgi:hypothetical protein
MFRTFATKIVKQVIKKPKPKKKITWQTPKNKRKEKTSWLVKTK